jgi:hypothetical protein
VSKPIRWTYDNRVMRLPVESTNDWVNVRDEVLRDAALLAKAVGVVEVRDHANILLATVRA